MRFCGERQIFTRVLPPVFRVVKHRIGNVPNGDVGTKIGAKTIVKRKQRIL
jgi:hypothetical protein